jgi:hypothetical protein
LEFLAEFHIQLLIVYLPGIGTIVFIESEAAVIAILKLPQDK